MENYQSALKYAEVSANSAGTATQKYGAYLDGVEAHVNSLKATFESFSITLLNSDVVKGVVDAGSAILSVLNVLLGNDLVQGIGTLNIALLTTAMIIGKNLKVGANGLAQLIDKVLVKGLGMASKAAGSLAMSLQLAIPLAILIGGIALFNKLNVTLEEQQTKLAEIQSNYQGVTSEVDALTAKLSDGTISPYEQARLDFLKQYQASLADTMAIQNRATIESELFGTGDAFSTGLVGNAEKLGRGAWTAGNAAWAENTATNVAIAINGTGSPEARAKRAKEVYDTVLIEQNALLETQGKLADALANPDVLADKALTERIQSAMDYVTARVKEYQGYSDQLIASGLVPYQTQIADSAQTASDSVGVLVQSFADFQAEVTATATKSSALSTALQQQTTDGYLSAESLAALTEAGVDYKSALDETTSSVDGYTKQYSINVEKMQEALTSNVELERSLLKLREATDRKKLAELEASDASETDIANLKLQLSQYEALDEQLLSLISSIGAYKSAIETANSSSDFDYATGTMLGTITDGMKTGRIATDEFKAAMSYFTDGSFGDSLTQDSIPAMQSFFDGISKYTQGGAAGLNAATEAFKGLLDANGQFKDGTTLEMVANALGKNVGTEFAYGLLKSYEDYGFNVNLEEIMRPEDWASVTSEITNASDDYLASYDKLLSIQDDIQQARYYGDDEGVARLTDQAKNLSASLSSSEITASINNLQTLLDSGKYQGASADAIQGRIDSLNSLLAFKAEMDAIPIEVSDNASEVISAVSSALYALDGRRATTYVDVVTSNSTSDGTKTKVTGKVPKGAVGKITGQNDASGNANAGGTWGRGAGGKTLVGELGREIVVDPATNRWYTVGDNGAQFVNLPQNAIVFNHQQSKSILSQGRLSSRGKALSSGNAAYNRFKDDYDTTFGSYDATYMVTSDGIRPIPGTPSKPGKGGPAASTAGEIYAKEIKLLEHQAKLIGDMLNMYAEGSDSWFEQQQNIIDTYKKSAELTEAEYWRLHALSGGVITDDMQKLMESLIDYKKEVFDASKEYWEAEKDNASNTLDYLKSQAQAVIDLKTSYHDLTKSIQSEQRDIDNQLKIAAEAYPNLTEAERAAAFSGDDYQELSRRLNAISAEAQTMYTSYLEQIQNVGEDASYELETITSEFERQYDLKLDQYNIAKAELGVLKARKNLENVQNERSVAMLIGGLWTWVADSDNVISAMESLSSAEQDLADAQSDASFNADKANWEGYISSIDNQIGAIDALVYSMDDLASEIHDLVDGVQAQIQMALSASTNSLFSSLPNYTGTSNALFNTANLQNLWTASVNNAIAGSGQSISTNTLIGELLANMASYGSVTPPATNNGDVLMWNGNVVAQGSDVTALINILRSLVPIFPVDN